VLNGFDTPMNLDSTRECLFMFNLHLVPSCIAQKHPFPSCSGTKGNSLRAFKRQVAMPGSIKLAPQTGGNAKTYVKAPTRRPTPEFISF
jgi:hypothetical protein